MVTTSPRSSAMRAEADAIVYTFDLGAARLGTVTFSVKARTPGYIDAAVRSGDAQASFREIVLP